MYPFCISFAVCTDYTAHFMGSFANVPEKFDVAIADTARKKDEGILISLQLKKKKSSK